MDLQSVSDRISDLRTKLNIPEYKTCLELGYRKTLCTVSVVSCNLYVAKCKTGIFKSMSRTLSRNDVEAAVTAAGHLTSGD